jgi:hypothetical protein
LLLYRQVGDFINLRGLGVHGLSELDAELFPDALELSEVLVVLALVLDLCLDACKGWYVSMSFVLARSGMTHPRRF